VQDDPRGGFDLQRFDRGDRAPQQADAPPQEYRRAYRGGFDGAQAEQRGEDNRWSRDGNRWNRDAGDLRQSERPLPNVMRSPNPLIVSRTPREGTQPPPREELRRRSEVQWSTNWRHDGRYDWRNWRDRHRSTFHVGIYYDPFGWGYRPYQIGWRLWPSYYSRQYWIDDPWEYRLPYAPPGTVWVRYWDDALLVDTWTGEVIDVIHGFFW
jgi:Ni/Co efflux regulator RcnB